MNRDVYIILTVNSWIVFNLTGGWLPHSLSLDKVHSRGNPVHFWEEEEEGLITPGLQSWPSQLIEHLAKTTSVAPPPADPAGCRPLYFLHLLNLSFTIWTPNRCCILQLRAYQSFVCNILSTPRCESQVPAKKTKNLSCFG